MVYEAPKGGYDSVLSQVWSGLGTDVRQQVTQLLAQLAFNLVVSQAVRSSTEEKEYAKVRFSQG